MQFGTNLPFIHYGDVGRNAWGWRGYSTEGFIPSRGFYDVKRVLSNPVSGGPALVLSADIIAQDPLLSSGDVTTELAVSMPVSCPKIPQGTRLNLEGVTVRLRLCVPAGSAGHTLQFVFTSQAEKTLGTLHSEPFSIEANWEGRFVDLAFRVSNTGPGLRNSAFDAARVAFAGFTVVANPVASGARIQGDFLVESFIFETTPPIRYDFAASLVERHFQATRELSARLTSEPPLARVFTLVDGRAGILWNPDGSPGGLDDRVFRDLDALVDSAERAQVQLLPVILDFKWACIGKDNGGVRLGGRSNVIRDRFLRQKFVDNVLDPILERYGNHPSVRAWEIMNEPEWVLSGLPGRPADTTKFEPIPLDDMRDFFRVCAQSVRRLTRHDATVGSARRSWVTLWKDVGLTLHCWHYYDSDPDDGFPWRGILDLGLQGPVLVTEVPTAGTRQRASDYLRAARNGGYHALCLWSCRAQDTFSDLPAAIADLESHVPQISMVVNGASYQSAMPIAPDSWLVLFGSKLAPSTTTAPGGSLPAFLNGVKVRITDSSGGVHEGGLHFVSAGQINCLVPSSVRTGPAKLAVSRLDGGLATVDISVETVSPGLFTANADGKGVAAAQFARVVNGRIIRTDPAYRCDANGKNCRPLPLRFGPANEESVLILFGTGIRHRSAQSAVTVLLEDRELSVEYAGPQNQFQGLDQVNVALPRDLVGSGEIAVRLRVDGLSSNAAAIHIE